MDNVQEVQLRTWAEALCGAAESDRRAMGKAILMLLEQIDSLRAELEQQSVSPQAPPFEEPAEEDMSADLLAETASVEDTATMSFRDRLRAATHRSPD